MRTHPRARAGRRAGRGAMIGALALVAVLTGCSKDSSGGSAADSAGGDGRFVAGKGTITVLDPGRRGEPIGLVGTTLEGTRLDLATLRGKTVVLNVWGSWCAPCRKEAPDLEAAYAQLKPRGVEFVGLNVREEDPAQARAFQRTFGVTYPSLADDGGSLQLALRGAVAPNAIPSTLVLDGEGRIAARVSGSTTKITLVGVVESVLTGTPLVDLPKPTASATP